MSGARPRRLRALIKFSGSTARDFVVNVARVAVPPRTTPCVRVVYDSCRRIVYMCALSTPLLFGQITNELRSALFFLGGVRARRVCKTTAESLPHCLPVQWTIALFFPNTQRRRRECVMFFFPRVSRARAILRRMLFYDRLRARSRPLKNDATPSCVRKHSVSYFLEARGSCVNRWLIFARCSSPMRSVKEFSWVWANLSAPDARHTISRSRRSASLSRILQDSTPRCFDTAHARSRSLRCQPDLNDHYTQLNAPRSCTDSLFNHDLPRRAAATPSPPPCALVQNFGLAYREVIRAPRLLPAFHIFCSSIL